MKAKKEVFKKTAIRNRWRFLHLPKKTAVWKKRLFLALCVDAKKAETKCCKGFIAIILEIEGPKFGNALGGVMLTRMEVRHGH